MNSFDLLKKLREDSGAGMLDCKKALDEANNDYQTAVEILRKKGIASAQKKIDRATEEGLVSFKSNENYLAICEVNCETDFVSRSDKFQEILDFCLDSILSNDAQDVESLNKLQLNGDTFENIFKVKSVSVGENVKLSRIKKISLSNASFNAYVHNAIETNPHAGTIVAITLTNKRNTSQIIPDLKKISMHIAATKPLALNENEVDSKILEKEREIFSEQAKASGKPENVVQKMIEGRIKKFLQENVLLEQQFVVNPDITISDFFKQIKKDHQLPELEITSFIRWQLGETK